MKRSFATLGLLAAPMLVVVGVARPANAEPLLRCDSYNPRTAVAGGETSCAFAQNVWTAWFTGPGNPVLAYSPVTHRVYSMMCVRGFDLDFPNANLHVTGATRCVDTEGDGAIAYVW